MKISEKFKRCNGHYGTNYVYHTSPREKSNPRNPNDSIKFICVFSKYCDRKTAYYFVKNRSVKQGMFQQEKFLIAELKRDEKIKGDKFVDYEICNEERLYGRELIKMAVALEKKTKPAGTAYAKGCYPGKQMKEFLFHNKEKTNIGVKEDPFV